MFFMPPLLSSVSCSYSFVRLIVEFSVFGCLLFVCVFVCLFICVVVFLLVVCLCCFVCLVPVWLPCASSFIQSVFAYVAFVSCVLMFTYVL